MYSTPTMKMTIALGRETVIPPQLQQHCVARALYDNIAESPDELAFRRGDLLTVLEQNTAGSEGWWLCSLRGRQGICPGNRLRLVPGVFETGGGLHRQHKRGGWATSATASLDRNHATASTPTSLSAKSVLISSIYENPVSEADLTQHYDVPRPRPLPATPVSTPTPNTTPTPPMHYDAPRIHQQAEWYDAPRAARPASAASRASAVSHSSSGSTATDDTAPASLLDSQDTYDVPRARVLPLGRTAALDALDKLQSETTCGVTKLLSLVRPGWRRRDSLDSVLLDARVAAARAAAALHDLTYFAGGALANAAHARDKALAPKLNPLVEALREADKDISSALVELDASGWHMERLARSRSPPVETRLIDPLDRLVSRARALTVDVQRVCSFVQGNSSLLFENDEPTTGDWVDEYDYVRLESRDHIDRRYADIHNALPDQLRGTTVPTPDTSLAADDRRLLAFYARHAVAYCGHLTDAVDAFLRAVELQQPPRAFLAHAKFVVLSAHRIVYAADTLHRGVKHTAIRGELRARADALSDGLATAVAATRAAAQSYPSSSAVREMTRAVAAVSAIASDLKHSMLQAATKP